MNFLSFSGQLLIERSDSNKDHRDLKQSGSSLKSKQIKVVNSREVREVVEGTTCISDKKLSEIC